MKLLTNFPVYEGWLDQYGSLDDLARDCAELGLDGLEVVWGEDESVSNPPPSDMVVGYPLLFFSNSFRANHKNLSTDSIIIPRMRYYMSNING